MFHHAATVNSIVPLPDGEGIAHASGGQGFKAQMGQQAGGSDVPGIGNDKSAVALVEGAKGASFFSLRQQGLSPVLGDVQSILAKLSERKKSGSKAAALQKKVNSRSELSLYGIFHVRESQRVKQFQLMARLPLLQPEPVGS
jgi:hypothetical protein